MTGTNVRTNFPYDYAAGTFVRFYFFVQSFASVMSDASMITRMGVNLLIRQTKSKPFIQQTAKEFMFGYESPIVTLGNKFLPSWIVFDKLGLIDRVSFSSIYQ